MSTTRLLMLGLIRWLEPVHGYEVRRELISWNVEGWANLKPGSIYHALRKLTEEGLLDEVGTERVEGRPARTLYRTTRFGQEEFTRLLRKYWWEHQHQTDPFAVAMSFLPSLPRREAVLALRNRAAVLRGSVDQARSLAQEWMAEKPVHVSWLLELESARVEAEIAWCERVAAKVEAGEGQHEDDPGNPLQESFAAWRAEMGHPYSQV
jgi:DNA-binding PadR family transcriptional regulator